MFVKNYVIVEPVTNKEGSFLNTETDITDSQTQERSRPRKDLDTVGGFLDSCKDATPSIWLPSNKTYQCSYMAKRVYIKDKYKLSMSSWEKAETKSFLTQCVADGN